MIQNGKDISTPQSAQVCVIGSGPAGITAAWELSQAGLHVILLDGARPLDYTQPNPYQQSWPDKVKLYNGVADGVFAQNNESDFLIRPYGGPFDPTSGTPRERERVYGGTSTHWGGQSRPLDPITFEKRPGGFPGWPITRNILDPYYAKVSKFNHLFGDYGTSGDNFTAAFWAAEMQKQDLSAAVPNLQNFDADMYQFMGKQWLDFSIRTFDPQGITIGASSVRVIKNATVLNIVEQGGSIQYLNVASMNDDPTNPQKATAFTVTADVYILACGAVENARQLLLSGIGNDLVGHYFMCHPLSSSSVMSQLKPYLSQAERNLMGGTNWIDPTGNINGITGRFTVNADTARSNGIGRCWFHAQPSTMYFEMTPNYNSYVALGQTTDPVFGQQQTHIHWEFSDQDQNTYETNCKLFNDATGGALSWIPWAQITDQWIVNGHHIGTTRMSASTAPTEGVVDQNLKIHGIDNIYVAGSSVFPTAGVSNPTTTIVTLSLRLAEYLQTQVKSKA